MSSQGWQETLVSALSDGPTLTAAAAATCIPNHAKYTVPANFWIPGKVVKVTAAGRISNVVTTPGTARFDLRMAGVAIFDSLAMNLNIVAKTNVPWWLEILLTCRAHGTSANLIGVSKFTSEAVIASPLSTVGSNGTILGPVGSAPAVGANFDSTVALLLDMFFTQTVATGSLTVHQYMVQALN